VSERNFKYLRTFLTRDKDGHNTPPITEVDKGMARDFMKHLEAEKKYANATYNKSLAIFRHFFNWAKEEELVRKNPFSAIRTKPVNPKIQIISKKEFNALLGAINPETGVHYYTDGSAKDLYHQFLKDGFRLGLYTGWGRTRIILESNICRIIWMSTPSGTTGENQIAGGFFFKD